MEQYYYVRDNNKLVESIMKVDTSGEFCLQSLLPAKKTKQYQLGTLLGLTADVWPYLYIGLTEHASLEEIKKGMYVDLDLNAYINGTVPADKSILIFSDMIISCLSNMLNNSNSEDLIRKTESCYEFLETCVTHREHCTSRELINFSALIGIDLKSSVDFLKNLELKPTKHPLESKQIHELLYSYTEDKKMRIDAVGRLKLEYKIQKKPLPYDIEEILDDYIDIQDKILSISCYKIDTISDMILCSLQEIFRLRRIIKQCEFCSRFFVPLNRTDSRYCNNLDFPIVDHDIRTCAEKARTVALKFSASPISKENKKTYDRVRQRLSRRCKDDNDLEIEEYEKFKSKYRDYRMKIRKHPLEIEYENNLKEWLKKIDNETRK